MPMPPRPDLVDPELMEAAEKEVARIRAEKYNTAGVPTPSIPTPETISAAKVDYEPAPQTRPPVPQQGQRPDRPSPERMREAQRARFDVATGRYPEPPRGRPNPPGERSPAYLGRGYLPPGAPGSRSAPYEAPTDYAQLVQGLQEMGQSVEEWFKRNIVGTVPGARGPLYEPPPEGYTGYTPDYHPGDTGRYDYPPQSPAQEIFENYPWTPSDTEGPPPDDIENPPPEDEEPDFPVGGGGYGGQNYPVYIPQRAGGYGRGDWQQWASRLTTWNF